MFFAFSPSCAIRLNGCLFGAVLACAGIGAQAALTGNIADLSLEDLMNIEVTSASRKAERLSHTPAAVFVITADDIRRSGATSIPDVLRMAPGVQAARIANNNWAVSVRGFNGRFANKLLVLMDGRSIYSPLFSGVVWEANDTNLEDIDHIEVIRGPGAALWGANAVNGVINIISKKAKDTQGTMVSASAGNHERGMFTARYGGSAGEDTQFRVYAKTLNRGPSIDMAGQRANGTSDETLVGFRVDTRLNESERFTVSGEARDSRGGDIWVTTLYTPPYSSINAVTEAVSGAHLLGRYERGLDDGSAVVLQGYLDHSEVSIGALLSERRDTADIDFQHRLRLGDRHDVIWGLNYRVSRDDLTGQGFATFAPRNRSFVLGSVFLHDEITLLPEELRLTLGAKLEHNNFAGNEPQPNVRLLWTPDATNSFWTALSRATRTPSRAERDSNTFLNVQPPFSARNPSPFPLLTLSVPNAAGGLKAERVDSLEFGYRAQLGSQLSFDAALFANRYDRLRAVSVGTTTLELLPGPVLVTRTPVDNSASANTRGIELALDWRPYAWWRLQPSYTYFRMSVPVTGDPARDGTTALLAGTTPRSQLSLRSQFDLAERQRFDAWLHYVGHLAWGGIPSRWDLDLRYAWQPRKDLELALVGQNLLHAQRPQFLTDFLVSPQLQIRRSAYLNAKWQF